MILRIFVGGYNMRYSNLHTHTLYSDGKNSIRENIEEAIEKSMLSIGFSDHSYTDFDLSYCIKKEKLSEYINEVRSLRREYADRIEVYLGYELDGFSNIGDRELYDYTIGDCHYLRTRDGYMSIDHSKDCFFELLDNYFDSDPMRMARDYFETYAERIRVIRPDVLGHFDLVSKFGAMPEDDEKYRAMARESLEASLEVTPIIEMNTGAISRGYKALYPPAFLFDTIREKGARIVLSSDSHAKQNLTFYFDEAVEILRANRFESIVALVGGKFEEFGIK